VTEIYVSSRTPAQGSFSKPHRQHQIVEIYGNIRDKTFLELTTILKTKINNQVKKKVFKAFF
jgi:hypothetical protein